MKMTKRGVVVTATPMAAILVALLMIVLAPSAQALTNVYRIQARLTQNGTKLCLDADARHVGAGAAVNVQKCNNNNAQKWQFGELNGYFVYINIGHPGYALAAGSLVAGSPMTLKKANGNDKTQHWQDDVLYSDHGVIYNQNNPHLVLEPRLVQAGRRVYLRKYEGITGAQSWVIVRLS